MLLVPAVIQFLLATTEVEHTDFSTVRAIVDGGSPNTDNVLVKGLERFGCEFLQVYGLTETTGSITQLDDHDPCTGADCCARAASVPVGEGPNRRQERRRCCERHGRRAVDPIAPEHARLLEQSRCDMWPSSASPHEEWGEAVKAVIVRAVGTSPSEAELIAYARRAARWFQAAQAHPA